MLSCGGPIQSTAREIDRSIRRDAQLQSWLRLRLAFRQRQAIPHPRGWRLGAGRLGREWRDDLFERPARWHYLHLHLAALSICREKYSVHNVVQRMAANLEKRKLRSVGRQLLRCALYQHDYELHITIPRARLGRGQRSSGLRKQYPVQPEGARVPEPERECFGRPKFPYTRVGTFRIPCGGIQL